MSSLITTIIIIIMIIIITCTLPLTKPRVARDVLPRGGAGRGNNGKQHFVLMQKRAVTMIADNKNVFAHIPLTVFTAFNSGT